MTAERTKIKAQRANKIAMIAALRSIVADIPKPLSYEVITKQRGDQLPIAYYPRDTRIETALAAFDAVHTAIIDDCKDLARARFNPDGFDKPARKG